MIRIQNDIPQSEPNLLTEVLQDKAVHEALEKLGVSFECGPHYDFVFAMANGLEHPKSKTIAFERVDRCQVRNKKLLHDSNVLKLVKIHKHATNQEQLSPYEWNKVTAGVSFLHYKGLDAFEEFATQHDWSSTTPIDVFFAGTTEYKSTRKIGVISSAVSEHRQSCVDKLLGLNCNVVVRPNKAYTSDEYIKLMAQSKVVVSPWGWGEYCYRDFEAPILHADVVKPRSPIDIFCYPHRYNRIPYYCEPDWSDLEEVIDTCLNTWDDRAKDRHVISEYLIGMRQPERIAEILYDIIQQASKPVRHDNKGRELLAKLCVGRGLDVGCGDKKITDNCTGIDRNSDAHGCEYVSDMNHVSEIACGWDFIVSSHCLEHSPDVIATLTDWYKALRNGGTVGITVPHGEHVKAKTLGDSCLQHKQLFTPKTLGLFLEHVGFKDVVSLAYDRPSAYKQAPGIFARGTKP